MKCVDGSRSDVESIDESFWRNRVLREQSVSQPVNVDIQVQDRNSVQEGDSALHDRGVTALSLVYYGR